MEVYLHAHVQLHELPMAMVCETTCIYMYSVICHYKQEFETVWKYFLDMLTSGKKSSGRATGAESWRMQSESAEGAARWEPGQGMRHWTYSSPQLTHMSMMSHTAYNIHVHTKWAMFGNRKTKMSCWNNYTCTRIVHSFIVFLQGKATRLLYPPSHM